MVLHAGSWTRALHAARFYHPVFAPDHPSLGVSAKPQQSLTPHSGLPKGYGLLLHSARSAAWMTAWMKRISILTLTTLWVAIAGWSVPQAAGPRQGSGSPATREDLSDRAVFAKYCITCHNQR